MLNAVLVFVKGISERVNTVNNCVTARKKTTNDWLSCVHSRHKKYRQIYLYICITTTFMSFPGLSGEKKRLSKVFESFGIQIKINIYQNTFWINVERLETNEKTKQFTKFWAARTAPEQSCAERMKRKRLFTQLSDLVFLNTDTPAVQRTVAHKRHRVLAKRPGDLVLRSFTPRPLPDTLNTSVQVSVCLPLNIWSHSSAMSGCHAAERLRHGSGMSAMAAGSSSGFSQDQVTSLWPANRRRRKKKRADGRRSWPGWFSDTLRCKPGLGKRLTWGPAGAGGWSV